MRVSKVMRVDLESSTHRGAHLLFCDDGVDEELCRTTRRPFQSSVAACIAAILELDSAEVPVPPDDHPEPWTVWRNWLQRRALGLVPVERPREFNWPGPWLALLDAADGDGLVGAVAFGAPPGIAWHPSGGPEEFEAVRAGYLLAPADVALWEPASG